MQNKTSIHDTLNYLKGSVAHKLNISHEHLGPSIANAPLADKILGTKHHQSVRGQLPIAGQAGMVLLSYSFLH